LLRFLRYGLFGLLLGFLFVDGRTSNSQSPAPAVSTSGVAKVSLADVVRNLPDYVDSVKTENYSQALEDATTPERDSAVPELIGWLKDDRPRVREKALFSIGLLYMPIGKHPEPMCSAFLPVQYVPVVAARFRDPDARVRSATLFALQSVEACGHGMDELIQLVVPMLHEPDAVTEYPDPSSVESDQRLLARIAKMPLQQQAEFKAVHLKMQQHGVPKLHAEGPELLSILTFPTRTPTNTMDDAMIEFLDRKDQMKSTLRDCFQTLAQSRASERVNDEVLRHVFEQKAMTVFLLQFVTEVRLTPTQLAVQKERLIAVSNDESERSSLREAAKTVAACWNEDRTAFCKPTIEEFQEDSRIDTMEHR